jgi:hypothetical protein
MNSPSLAGASLAPRSGESEAVRLLRFQWRPLRVHRYLAGVPMHSLDVLELPGGPPNLTLAEIASRIGFTGEASMPVGWVTGCLFRLRGLIGRVLHWDDPRVWREADSIVSRLDGADRARSLIQPGTPAGISRIVFQFENEMLGEIINRTVHCYWVIASEPRPDGYTVWLAVYVQRRNWFTPVYMAAISPMLNWVIYPAMLRGARRRWDESCRAPADQGTITAARGVLATPSLLGHARQFRGKLSGTIGKGCGAAAAEES